MSTISEKETRRQTAGRWNWSKTKSVVVIAAVIAVLLFARSMKNGRNGQQPQQQPSMPTVITQTVEKADLAAEREYVGRVDPIQSVSLRPQVNGEISQIHFKDGSLVKAGQLLFSIDSKQYQAAVDARKADLSQAEANNDRASRYFERLKASDQRSVSAVTMEAAESDMLQGRAAVEQAKAALKTAQINLAYTRITAPITGHVGKAMYTKGNFVTSASELTTIVQTDPIRVTFTIPDRDYINQLDQFKKSGNDVFNATVRLANGDVYTVSGVRDFENNRVDSATGTMMMALRYKNENGLLVPGSMVRVAVKPAKTHIAPIIPQSSIMADSNGDYVYIIDGENKVHQRRVKLGVAFGVVREVISGVEAGETIVTKGLQSIRDGMEVMPTSAKADGDELSASELAKQSGYDAKTVSDHALSQDMRESSEGKN